MHPVIETPRVLLRRFTLDDVEASLEMNLHESVRRFLPWEPVHTMESMRKVLLETTLTDYEIRGFGRWAVVHKDTGRMIGFTGLKYEEEIDEVDVGYRLHPDFWGQGIATEASLPCIDYGFEVLGLEKIVAGAVPGNEASFRVMEKLGLSYERHIDFDDLEMELYSISRRAYQTKRAAT